MRFAFSCARQVEIHPGCSYLERNVHFARRWIYRYEADRSFEIVFVSIDRYVSILIV